MAKPLHVRMIENVPWYPFAVRYRLADGRLRRRLHWSPGYPWVYDEVGRGLLDQYGEHGVMPGSCVIRQLQAIHPEAVNPRMVRR